MSMNLQQGFNEKKKTEKRMDLTWIITLVQEAKENTSAPASASRCNFLSRTVKMPWIKLKTIN